MTLVSIITPVFNAERWLEDMLASVAAQSFTNWEHLLVDDGSTDSSAALIERAARADPRIRLLRMPGNGGPARARNAALELAKGRYIAFLDADDLWLPAKLERSLDFLRQSGCDFCYHAFRYLSADGTSAGPLVQGPPRLTLRAHHTRRGTGDCMSMVIDRERVPGFRFAENRSGLHEDWLAWLGLVRSDYRGCLLAEDLGRYRLSGSSRNAGKLAAARKVWHLYRRVEDLSWAHAAGWWCLYAWNSLWLHLRSRPRSHGRAAARRPAGGDRSQLESPHSSSRQRAGDVPV
jgi:teichuronic acid biosynthesis glycosyltransferase TuaG